MAESRITDPSLLDNHAAKGTSMHVATRWTEQSPYTLDQVQDVVVIIFDLQVVYFELLRPMLPVQPSTTQPAGRKLHPQPRAHCFPVYQLFYHNSKLPMIVSKAMFPQKQLG